MSETGKNEFLNIAKRIFVFAALPIFVLGVSLRLRGSSYIAPLQLFGYLQIASSIMALTFAAISLLRFRSDRDRFSLFLGLAFLLSGVAILLTLPGLSSISPGSGGKTPWPWWLSRSLFACLLVAAVVVGRRVSTAIHPLRETFLALVIAVGGGFLAIVGYHLLPESWAVHPSAAITRPANLALVFLFLIPAFEFGRRFRKTGLPSDAGIFVASVLNVACHMVASESWKFMDAAFLVSQGLKMLSYAAAMGGTLVQSAKLYEEVRSLAIRDSLTGLANYHFFVGVIETEIQRSMRTGREFIILLFDLDGLKNINDRYGHATGNEALCRLANILQVVCRGTDTAARFGGDEFVVVLPETGEESAQRVIARLVEKLANDSAVPHLSVSVGLAVCPDHGTSLTALVEIADKSLYAMKHDHKLRLQQSKI